MPTIDAIKKLLIRRYAQRASKLGDEASIADDLGLDGADASELIHDVEMLFGKDLSVTDFDRFFRGESGFMWGRKETITLRQLAELVDAAPARKE